MKKTTRVFLLLAGVIHLLFWVSLGTGMFDGLFNDSSHRIGKGGDFFQFYQAGHDLLAGKSIYSGEKELVIPYGALNKYPPLLSYTLGVAAQLFSPFTAYKIWILCIGLFFVGFFFVIRALVPSRETFFQIMVLSLVFTPYYLDLYMGQTNTLMAFLIALLMYSAVQQNANTVCTMALSLNIKMNTFLCIPLYIAKRWWKQLFLVAGVCALLFFPYFLFHPADLSYFLTYVFGAPLDYFYQAGNVGIYPLLADLFGLITHNKIIVIAIQMAWTLSVVLIAVYIHIRTRTTDPIDYIILWMACFFIAFKFVWEHHLVMALPLLAMEYSRSDKRSIGCIWILLALPTLFGVFDMNLGRGYTEVQPYWTHAQSVLYHAGKVIPLGTFFIVILCRLLNRKVVFKNTLMGICIAWSIVCLLAFAVPRPAGDYIAQARVALFNDDPQKAEQMFQTALRVNPAFSDAWIIYGKFLYDRGEIDKANEALLKARSLDPNHPIFSDQ